jgi:hypothetical protein
MTVGINGPLLSHGGKQMHGAAVATRHTRGHVQAISVACASGEIVGCRPAAPVGRYVTLLPLFATLSTAWSHFTRQLTALPAVTYWQDGWPGSLGAANGRRFTRVSASMFPTGPSASPAVPGNSDSGSQTRLLAPWSRITSRGTATC